MSNLVAQRELILPLIEGIHANPPWGEFLKHLVARTYARRAFLLITLTNAGADHEPTVVHAVAPRAATEPPISFRQFARVGLIPYGVLRPERVYSLEEMLDYSRSERAAEQRAELDEMGARYGRFMRVSAGGVADAWLLLVREREDFSAAAVATLSSVAMPLAAALKTLVALMDQRLHAALGQASLQKLGIGHVAFDDKGRVIAADAMAEAMLSFVQDPDHPGERRLQAGPAARQVLDQACADFASGRAADPVMLFIGGESGLWLLLGRAQLSLPEPCAIPAAIGSLRTYTRENSMHARKMLRTMYGLSINEAALAHELSLGKSIIEAGRGLNLTAETSRNYSKRIYAKTGATSQADLVRLILTGLSPLA